MINEIYIKIEGLNLFRVVQKLVDSGIMVSNLKIKQSYMLFSINDNYLEKLKQVCKKERKKFYIVKNTKIGRFFAKIPYLIGVFLSFSLLFAVFYGIHNTVFSINLTCDSKEKVDLIKIEELLSDNNIKAGLSKSNLSLKEIENLIIMNSDNVSGCKVFYEGLNLNIEIFPATKNDENVKVLYSKYDAIVTSVKVFAGNLKIKKGDIIKAGDILIESDKESKGEVFGKVYFSSTQIFNEKQDETIKTGNIFETENLTIANLFNIKNDEKCNFKNYKTEIKTEILNKNLFFPIYKNKIIYKEIEIKEKIIKFETVEDEIKESLKEETIKKLPETAEIKNITYSVVKEGTLVRIDCFVETEISLI